MSIISDSMLPFVPTRLSAIYFDGDCTLPSVHETRLIRLFVSISAGTSILLSALIALFAATDYGAYRIAFAMVYVIAYMVVAYWTWRLSRVAAVGALGLYTSMHHVNCGRIHVLIHLLVCVVFAASIGVTVLHHRTVNRAYDRREHIGR